MNENKILQCRMEMAWHMNGAVQFWAAMCNGRCATKEQLGDWLDYEAAKLKYDIESNPSISRAQKDRDERWVEGWKSVLKSSISTGAMRF